MLRIVAQLIWDHTSNENKKMTERLTPVRPIRVRLFCNFCPEVEMIRDGAYPTAPPRYPHYCPICGDKQTTSAMYPHIRYVSDEDLEDSMERR